jgi:cytochrome c5
MSRGKEGRRQKAEGRSGFLPNARVLLFLLLSAFCLLPSACRQKMSNQPRYDPLEASDFFADGMAARPRIEGTVARGDLSGNPFFDTGKINGQIADGFPFPVTREVVDRGQERFNIYCSECHGRLGDGNGMIPSRGFRRPPSYHTDRLRNQPTGHFFDVMTNGFGAMPKYGTMIPVPDRWAIIAYIRALQLSQNATVDDVPAGERGKIGATPGPHTDASGPHTDAVLSDFPFGKLDEVPRARSAQVERWRPRRLVRRRPAPPPLVQETMSVTLARNCPEDGRRNARAASVSLSVPGTRAVARDAAASAGRMPALHVAASDRSVPETQPGGAR